MISGISSKATAAPESFNADWMRSREKYQQAAREIQQKTDQVKEGLTLQLEETIRRVRDRSDVFHTQLSFNVQKSTHRVVIKVMDTETNQIIRQIPPEQMLRVSEEIQKIIGSFIDRLA